MSSTVAAHSALPVTAEERTPFDAFFDGLVEGDVVEALNRGLIGKGLTIDGPFGPKTMVYADYVASGRALRQIETFMLEEVLPFYANSHTEASFCGATTTRLREAARKVVGDACGAGDEHAVIFTGSGATAGLNRLVHLFGIDAAVKAGEMPVVLVGPYEHHSNILPWRESGALVIEIGEAAEGGPDMAELREALEAHRAAPVLVGAFSAASNVTGILSDIDAVTALLKAFGARVVWDYACAAPYVPIAMTAGGAEIDAIALSAHKFIGGPGASGILIVRRDAVSAMTPSWPGGGTVLFVSSVFHDYLERIEDREEAGTPNIVGDIRAALVFLVKAAVGEAFIAERNRQLVAHAFDRWRGHPRIEVLGGEEHARLPVFSFRVRDGEGYVPQQLFTRMLSDAFGIQTRGGCVCAGPYAHRLLGIDPETSQHLREEILGGDETHKPGFTRLNLSYLMDDETVDFILDSVVELAENLDAFAARYADRPEVAICRPM
ncbi:MAG: aminotransferase [Hyphomicrobiales bacterium]|nr:MAG: aminotransferase [Hyphomicrobiales bacterium]